jgi:hypothetical protein
MAPVQITKNSGTTEAFNKTKFQQSLRDADTSEALINEILGKVEDILHDGISTQEIFKESYKHLQNHSKQSAGRYRLKEAIFELGPSSQPFEQFTAELLKNLGYETELGVTALGECITHDIDVIAQNDDAYILVECKFFGRDDERCNVKVPLYFQSQFQDIKKKWSKQSDSKEKIYKGWIVTNTRFSYDAEEYGNCVALKLLSWDFPRKKGIKDLVKYFNLYPVTCLSSLTGGEKNQLIENDIVFCNQVAENKDRLESVGINPRQVNRIAKEAREICS